MSLSAGSRLGPYEILAPLGAGGMGEVYRARDTRLDRTVAIKILNSALTATPDLKARFEREARAISQLNHPHVCVLYDVGHEGDVDFLVMEYLEGESLDERLTRGAVPLDQLIKIGFEIADALDRAHRAGIVHRDLKPGNIRLTKSGAKLMDFGLAKPAVTLGMGAAAGPLTPSTPTMSVAALTSPASPLTQKGQIVGTFQYMAPELLQGSEADPRSDIFSFGCVLYEMVTGRRAFEGKSQISVASAILEKEPQAITEIKPLSPPALDHVIQTCLAKDPENRYQTARDVVLELKWISNAGTQAGPISINASRRYRWLPWAVTAVAMAAAAATWYARAPRPQPVVRAAIELPDGSRIGDGDSPVAFSSEGKRLAITVFENGKSSLWIRSLDSQTAYRLAGTEGATYPTWSPDGKSLAFFADHKIMRVDVASGMVQGICDADDGRGLAWGPDDTLVFAPAPFGGLFTVSAAGGTPAELTKPDTPGSTHRLPVFLPGGKDVLFFDGRGGTGVRGLDAVSLATRKVQHVLDTNSGARYVAPGYLLYVKDGSLLAQRFDAASLKIIGGPIPAAQQVRFTPLRSTGAWDASSDGSLVFEEQSGHGKYQWTWVDREGKVLAKIGEPSALGLSIASLSPDNTRVATAYENAIWIYNLSGGAFTRATFEGGVQLDPVWSPDGKSFVYETQPTPGEWTIWRKRADGSGTAEPVYKTNLQVIPSSWSPDGKFLAIVVSGGGNAASGEIWMLPMIGEHKPVPFLQGAGRLFDPAFSPDGHWLLYTAAEAGRNQSYLVPFPGAGGKWQVPGDGCASATWWTNREIVCLTADRLFGVEVNPTRESVQFDSPRPLLQGQDIFQANGGLFAHDGKRAIIAVPVGAAAAPKLNLVTNWTATLKK